MGWLKKTILISGLAAVLGISLYEKIEQPKESKTPMPQAMQLMPGPADAQLTQRERLLDYIQKSDLYYFPQWYIDEMEQKTGKKVRFHSEVSVFYGDTAYETTDRPREKQCLDIITGEPDPFWIKNRDGKDSLYHVLYPDHKLNNESWILVPQDPMKPVEKCIYLP
jgi:hypothetical protein